MTITKVAIRKYLHLAGTLIAGGAAAAIWVANLGIPLSAKISGTLVLATTLLTSLEGALGKADELVDLLPIPEGTTTTTTTTTVTTLVPGVVQDTRLVDPADPDEITKQLNPTVK
jgi:hypothetical protein